MFRALGRVGVRIGLAVGLVLIIVGIVVAARFGGNRAYDNPDYANEPGTSSTVDPTAGDDAEVLPTPSYGDNQAVEDAANAFASA